MASWSSEWPPDSLLQFRMASWSSESPPGAENGFLELAIATWSSGWLPGTQNDLLELSEWLPGAQSGMLKLTGAQNDPLALRMVPEAQNGSLELRMASWSRMIQQPACYTAVCYLTADPNRTLFSKPCLGSAGYRKAVYTQLLPYCRP